MEMANRSRLPIPSTNNTAAPIANVGGVDDGLLDNNGGRPPINRPDAREPGEEDNSRGVRPTTGDRERPTGRPPVSEVGGVDDGLFDDNGRRPPTNRPGAREPGEDDDSRGGRPTTGDREWPIGRPAERPNNRPPKPWIPDVDVDPNVNDGINYSTKKTIAQGMMDIALLTANASQLRYILRAPYWDSYHYANITLISISLIIQLVVGVILIFLGRYAYKGKEERQRAQVLNDAVVGLIFAITVVNIFIATFGVDDEKTTFLRLCDGSNNKEPLTKSG